MAYLAAQSIRVWMEYDRGLKLSEIIDFLGPSKWRGVLLQRGDLHA